MNQLDGQIALVTGGFGALGSIISRTLLDYGAQVFATHRSGHPPAEPMEGIIALPCDVTDEESVAQCFQEVRSRSKKRISILVHAAGGFRSDGSIEQTSVDTWNRMIRLNLTSSFLTIREYMRQTGSAAFGRVVLISALSAFKDGRGAVAYRTSKAGVKTIVDIAEAEKRHRGITVNALAPLIIDTEQNRKEMPNADRSSWVSPQALAEMVAHLCTPAGASITGNIISLS